MAVIKPFRALRPTKEKAHLVASVPYDVVSRDEAMELASGNEFSLLRITRAEIDFDPSTNQYSKEIYQKAKANLDEIRKKAPLIKDDSQKFYLYRLVMGEQKQIGIAATFSVDDYDNDVILKHEKTRREKEDDRTNHILTTEAQTGPVFLTYKDRVKIDDAVSKIILTEPEYDFTAVDDVQHTIWIVPEGYNELIISEIKSTDKIYIADGHHRAASASRARTWRKENNPNHNGTEDYNFFIGVLFPAEQLKILPYNRIVFDLNGLSESDFLNKVEENFVLSETSSPSPDDAGNIGMYLNKKWYNLQPNENVKRTSNVGDNLDVSILQNYLLEPILGIDDPRTNKRVDFIGGIRGTTELEKLVDSGKAAAAFSMFPVSVKDLMRISDAGEIMPPKSTWFEPKLRDGLLIHLI
ncbi:MAG: DUF1015 domain-containing protein [Ignavibacteria bacterium]|nr:DUF1015 domain-containing protein [Ignavibacteria bacterium]